MESPSAVETPRCGTCRGAVSWLDTHLGGQLAFEPTAVRRRKEHALEGWTTVTRGMRQAMAPIGSLRFRQRREVHHVHLLHRCTQTA